MTKPPWWDEARRAIAGRDPVLATVIAACGGLHLVPRGDPFVTLARSIVGQQISVKAAQAVWARFEKRCGQVTPERVARMQKRSGLACGLSQRKAEYVKDLASRFVSGAVDPRRWSDMDDEAIIDELVQVRGIGRWTAEMFLIFNLLRPDVFPADDLGILRAIGLAYRGGEMPAREEARRIAERWRPWRTLATWYLWRSLDVVPVAVAPMESR